MEQKILKNLADIQTGPFGSQLHKEDYVENGGDFFASLGGCTL